MSSAQCRMCGNITNQRMVCFGCFDKEATQNYNRIQRDRHTKIGKLRRQNAEMLDALRLCVVAICGDNSPDRLMTTDEREASEKARAIIEAAGSADESAALSALAGALSHD